MVYLQEEYEKVSKGIEPGIKFPEDIKFDEKRRWSYGDVENNGVFYHPKLTDYSHQAFETYFLIKTGLTYSDLSRDSYESMMKRKKFNKDLERMTFPIGAFYQFMFAPMKAGDEFGIWIDTINISPKILGLRAWTISTEDFKAKAVVAWLRWAKLLGENTSTIEIPEWFPKRSKMF